MSRVARLPDGRAIEWETSRISAASSDARVGPTTRRDPRGQLAPAREWSDRNITPQHTAGTNPAYPPASDPSDLRGAETVRLPKDGAIFLFSCKHAG